MLSSLTLTNFALVKSESVNFSAGFNCLLGQSGAGKSVIIDALAFLLGGKANKEQIRSGESQLRVDGVFVDLPKSAAQTLESLEIECGDELILSRTLSLEGKSTCRVNGLPVTAKILQQVTENLAEFCGQHESVGLLNENNHLSILDEFAGEAVGKQKSLVKEQCANLSKIKSQIANLGGSEESRAREIDLLSFQINEIEEAKLSVEEEKNLKDRMDFISKSEKIFEKVNLAISALDSDRENAQMKLYEAKNSLSGLSEFDEIEEVKGRIEGAYYEIQDVVSTLEQIRESTEFNPRELEEIDARLDEIKNLKRKYGRTIDDVLQFLENARQRLDELEKSSEILEKLQKEEREVQEALQKNCEILSDMRKRAAEDFEKKLMRELADLEMKNSRFAVNFSRGECSSSGFDIVKFFFSANVGQEVRQLSKVASGGELSRLLLAFKNVMRGANSQTVIFDEIDSGISGRTAGILAEKLKCISKFNQIICITHTPVVAAKADNFLLVEKKVESGETFSHVHTLEDEAIEIELARLIDDSEKISQTAIEHAKKLLSEEKS